MAKAKLHQIKLTTGDNATQPPFPGGWVLAIFDALNSYAPALADKYGIGIKKRTKERIKAAEPVKQFNYDQIESKLVELVSALFPKISTVNGFAGKYVNEYFRLWKISADTVPAWLKSLGFKPGEKNVLGRALTRDLVLRLCYLESCERKLNQDRFSEAELDFLRHDTPAHVYQFLIAEKVRSQKLSMEKLAEVLQFTTDRTLRRIKRGTGLPPHKLLLDLQRANPAHRLLAGIGFVDYLLKSLGLKKSELRHEFLPVASVFFRFHPSTLDTFKRRILYKTKSGKIRNEVRNFERFIKFGDNLLLHPGFDELWSEMPDSLWRCHLYTLQFARNADLAQAYFQFATESSDAGLERFLCNSERESDGTRFGWMDKLRQKK